MKFNSKRLHRIRTRIHRINKGLTGLTRLTQGFKGFTKNSQRIQSQDEQRKLKMKAIMKKDKIEIDSPWLATQKTSQNLAKYFFYIKCAL